MSLAFNKASETMPMHKSGVEASKQSISHNGHTSLSLKKEQNRIERQGDAIS